MHREWWISLYFILCFCLYLYYCHFQYRQTSGRGICWLNFKCVRYYLATQVRFFFPFYFWIFSSSFLIFHTYVSFFLYYSCLLSDFLVSNSLIFRTYFSYFVLSIFLFSYFIYLFIAILMIRKNDVHTIPNTLLASTLSYSFLGAVLLLSPYFHFHMRDTIAQTMYQINTEKGVGFPYIATSTSSTLLFPSSLIFLLYSLYWSYSG